MLDLAFVRNNLPLVEEKLRARGADPDALLKNFRDIDSRRRAVVVELETANARRNELSKQIGPLKGAEKKGSLTPEQAEQLAALSTEVAALKERIPALEEQRNASDAELQKTLAVIPNLPQDSVPVGRDESANKEVKRWGAPPKFDFEPKSHWDLGPALGILDMERATKLTGARFALYWDMGARLERALTNFMLDLHCGGRGLPGQGYTEVLPPFLVNADSMYGTGQLPKFEEDLFKVPHGERNLYLIPTAEVPVTNIYRDEIIEQPLPVNLTAFTPCWRSEAGSYGKDTRGIIRQHQFQKVELVKFAKPEESDQELENLTRNAEEVLEKLGLHYRRMLLSTGDMGFSSAKTFDLEVWLPGQQLFREISSCSNFESFQARRANIRYRPEGKKGTELVHTLNGSGLAVGRTWVAIIENYQQADGSVLIPEALQPYMGCERITAKKF